MSMSFEIFPTKRQIPRCDEIIQHSALLFSEFMQRENMAYDIRITAREVSDDKKVCMAPVNLVSSQEHHTVFNLNEEGEVYVFYHELTELDREFWKEELRENRNARMMEEEINISLELGYSWSVKRTMGQPAALSLYYGYLAIAIARLTDGILYSDDGAWDCSRLPVGWNAFKKEYPNPDKVSDAAVKENIKTWLNGIRASAAARVGAEGTDGNRGGCRWRP